MHRIFFASLVCGLSFASVAHATLPQIVYGSTITQDTNATTVMAQLPLSTLGMAPYTTSVGSPPTSIKFNSAGSYKVIAQFMVTSDMNTMWGFGVQWDLATPGTYTLPVVTTPMTWVAGTSANTYTATLTIDTLYVSAGDAISFAASVRPLVAGTAYVIQPKVLHGLANTVLAVTTSQ